MISLIMPSWNKGEFISHAIDSVLNQDWDDSELIVVDNCSSDDTSKILESYINDIILIEEPDSGQSDAINKGVKQANGDIVGWLNADDLLYPDALKNIFRAFALHPDVGVVYGSGSKIDLYGNLIKDIPFREYNERLLRKIFYILQPSMFFKKELFIEVGGLNTASYYVMDWELVLKFMPVTNILAIPEKIAMLRMYQGTKSSEGGWEKYREISNIARKYNSINDINYISFQLRNITLSIKNRTLQHYARRVVDIVCNCMSKGELYMVCNWPEGLG